MDKICIMCETEILLDEEFLEIEEENEEGVLKTFFICTLCTLVESGEESGSSTEEFIFEDEIPTKKMRTEQN